MMKQLFIPVTAFAVTATSVSAFNTDILDKIDVDLSSDQVAALEAVHELRMEGADRTEIIAVLDDADLDRETMHEIRTAAREYRTTMREEIHAAIDDEDYDAFQDAIEGTRLEDTINSESDFKKIVEAHELKEAGDREGAKEIFEELGLERPEHKKGKGAHRGGEGRGFGSQD